MSVVAISGSLRSESTNSRLIEATAYLSEGIIEVTSTDLIGRLPLFNPDLDATSIDAVSDWTALMRQADALIISTPEYARGYPGALKNALDWLVQGDGFVEKPFCFFMASERAEHSHKTLTTVLETMSGVHVTEADATIHLLGTNYSAQEIATHPEFSDTIRTSLGVLGDAIHSAVSPDGACQ